MRFFLIFFFLLSGTLRAQSVYINGHQLETQGSIACERFTIQVDSIFGTQGVHRKYHFTCISKDNVFITCAWTGDPHYIESYPREPLIYGKEYTFDVIFSPAGKHGPFSKDMGFSLSNGETIRFRFTGYIDSSRKE